MNSIKLNINNKELEDLINNLRNLGYYGKNIRNVNDLINVNDLNAVSYCLDLFFLVINQIP